MSLPTYRHLLVPTDFGDAARVATEHAIAIAKRFDAKLTLLHAYELPRIDYGEVIPWPIQDLEDQAQRALDRALADVKAVHPTVDGLVVLGDPHGQILDVAEKRRCDLIVMGTHGRRGFSRILLGSVAERVVRFSPVPVLTMSTPAGAAERTRAT